MDSIFDTGNLLVNLNIDIKVSLHRVRMIITSLVLPLYFYTLHSLPTYSRSSLPCEGKNIILHVLATKTGPWWFLEKIQKLFEDCVRNGTIPDLTHQKCYRYGTQGMCEEGALLFLDPSDHCNTRAWFQILIYIN